MNRFLTIPASILVLSLLSGTSFAKIESFQRDLYDRIIIDPAGSGSITKNGSIFTIPYGESVDNTLTDDLRTVERYTQSGNVLTLELNDAVEDTRHFKIGNRVILDLFFNAAALANQSVPKVKTEEEENTGLITKQERASAIETEAAAPASTPAPNEEKPKPKALIEIQEESPELSLNTQVPDGASPTLISISSTQNLGLSVFKRLGRLFIVTDQKNIAIPPQISGQGANLNWKLTEIPMDNGRAWMMPLDDDLHIRPEGDGLVWRLVISDINPQLTTSEIRRVFTDPIDPKIDIIISDTQQLLRLTDPDYGDDLAVVTSTKSASRMLTKFDFVDFDILPAIVGAVIKPESDGIRVASTSQYIRITKRDGLNIAKNNQGNIVNAYLNKDNRNTEEPIEQKEETSILDRIFFFTDWGYLSNPGEFIEKRKNLDQALALAEKDRKLPPLLDLIKLTIAQGMGAEAIGYLDLARDYNPQIGQTLEYKALRGAAHFMARQYDLALPYFNDAELSQISEIQLWRAAAQSALNDHEAALETYSGNASLSDIYPYTIRYDVITPLAKAFLEQDQANEALPLIDLLEQDIPNNKTGEHMATLAYLKGRAQSVTGRPDEGISNLYKASLGDKLGPYGIRSELLLINDELAREVITKDVAIQRMERLRFAWRGDALETEIYKALGELYIHNEQPRRGLTILKQAAANTTSNDIRRNIVRTMALAYQSIFNSEEFADLDPMIAVAVYDEFKELTPVGDEGNELINNVADKLMSISLLSRASDVLTDKMNRLGEGQDAIKSGLRITAIQLIDDNPTAAFETLSRVDNMISSYQGEDKDELNAKVVLLKARAYADMGEPETALFMTEGLDDTDDVIRLRVDTAWRSGQWVAVTDNLSKLLARSDINEQAPPTPQQTQLILNQAVALSLSDQYDALQRFANDYDSVMRLSPSYKTFRLITRPQNISNLADRETLLDVTSEVDLFNDFLQNIEN